MPAAQNGRAAPPSLCPCSCVTFRRSTLLAPPRYEDNRIFNNGLSDEAGAGANVGFAAKAS